jgi:hypothetical protein
MAVSLLFHLPEGSEAYSCHGQHMVDRRTS